MFQTINMGVNAGDQPSGWWGVFIVSPSDPKDRYLISGTFDKQRDADYFTSEMNRIARMWR